jgi:hypothetical protein
MKNVLLSCLLCIGLMGCEDNYKHISNSTDNIFDINGKKCELVILNPRDGGRFYYIDCPTGSSLQYSSGKNSTTTVVTSKPEATQTSEPVSCPMPRTPVCNCNQ